MPQMTREQIRMELKHRGFDGFTDDDLNRYINWGYFYLARKMRVSGVEQQQTFMLTPPAYYVDLDTMTPRPKSIRTLAITTVDHQAKLDLMDDEVFWRDWSPWGFGAPNSTITDGYRGEPTEYYVFDRRLIIMPAPNTALTYFLRSWNRVDELEADGTAHVLPIENEEALMLSVMRVCHVRSNETERANDLKLDVQEAMNDILNENTFIRDELQEQTVPDDEFWLAS
jgi:hypothetical protein